VARVECQLGHCFRTTGKTGTPGGFGVSEQEYVVRLFNVLKPKLRAAGHTPIRVLADPRSYPACDLFFAFHCDGGGPQSRGCSFGYDKSLPNAAASKALGDRWRAEHNAAGFPGGNRPTNYTANLAAYYGLERATKAGAKRAICIEFGFLTNRGDNDWLVENVERVVDALVRTVVHFHGGTAPGEDLTIVDNDTKRYLDKQFAEIDKQFAGVLRRVDQALQRIGGRTNTVYNNQDPSFKDLVMAKEALAEAKAARQAALRAVDDVDRIKRHLGITRGGPRGGRRGNVSGPDT
jgi:hypothetical protein